MLALLVELLAVVASTVLLLVFLPEGTLSLLPLPIKDPFHLPRGMMMCIDVLERLKSEQ